MSEDKFENYILTFINKHYLDKISNYDWDNIFNEKGDFKIHHLIKDLGIIFGINDELAIKVFNKWLESITAKVKLAFNQKIIDYRVKVNIFGWFIVDKNDKIYSEDDLFKALKESFETSFSEFEKNGFKYLIKEWYENEQIRITEENLL